MHNMRLYLHKFISRIVVSYIQVGNSRVFDCALAYFFSTSNFGSRGMLITRRNSPYTPRRARARSINCTPRILLRPVCAVLCFFPDCVCQHRNLQTHAPAQPGACIFALDSSSVSFWRRVIRCVCFFWSCRGNNAWPKLLLSPVVLHKPSADALI